jgi:O-6-methylguanine DNA methyltransferase
MKDVKPVSTSAGVFHARFSQRGLAELRFPERPAPARTAAIGRPAGGRGAAEGAASGGQGGAVPARWEADLVAALGAVLAGKSPRRVPPLDVEEGTPFQRQVWQALTMIAPGRTSSYVEIARNIGRPKAARAVGQACGANPIPLLIPCHRVLAADGRLGGFSGGLDWKRELPAREGITAGANDQAVGAPAASGHGAPARRARGRQAPARGASGSGRSAGLK